VVVAGLEVLSQYLPGKGKESNKTSANIAGDPAKIRTRDLRSLTITPTFSVESSVRGRIRENNEKPVHVPRFELGMYWLRSRRATNSTEILAGCRLIHVTEANLPQLEAMKSHKGLFLCILNLGASWRLTHCPEYSGYYVYHLSVYLCLYSPLLDLGRFFSFLILYTVVTTPRKGDKPVARSLPTHRTTHTYTHTHIINVHKHPRLE
jgi:hypothetical protein